MLSEAATKLLEMVPRGQARAIHRKVLAMRLQAEGFPVTDRTISELTDELIQAGYPVASSRAGEGGVFLCETEEERRVYSTMLQNTIIALAKRLRAFDKAAHERLVAQGIFPWVRGAA